MTKNLVPEVKEALNRFKIRKFKRHGNRFYKF